MRIQNHEEDEVLKIQMKQHKLKLLLDLQIYELVPRNIGLDPQVKNHNIYISSLEPKSRRNVKLKKII